MFDVGMMFCGFWGFVFAMSIAGLVFKGLILYMLWRACKAGWSWFKARA